MLTKMCKAFYRFKSCQDYKKLKKNVNNYRSFIFHYWINFINFFQIKTNIRLVYNRNYFYDCCIIRFDLWFNYIGVAQR